MKDRQGNAGVWGEKRWQVLLFQKFCFLLSFERKRKYFFATFENSFTEEKSQKFLFPKLKPKLASLTRESENKMVKKFSLHFE